MGSKVLNSVVGIWKIVAKYPALSAGLGNVLVVVGASLGLHFTTTQLATTASVVAAIFGVLVHAGVIPLAKAKEGNVPSKVAEAVISKADDAAAAKTDPLATQPYPPLDSTRRYNPRY